MAMLTQAAIQTSRPWRLRASVVAGLIALTLAATVLLLLHVQLRFAIRNVGIDTRVQQKRLDDLRSLRNELASELEGMKSQSHVLEYARKDLGMVTYDRLQVQTLWVSMKREKQWRAAVKKKDDLGRVEAARTMASRFLEDGGARTLGALLPALNEKEEAKGHGKPHGV